MTNLIPGPSGAYPGRKRKTMFKGYNELTALEPTEYLNWQQFETIADIYPENIKRKLATEQYRRGYDLGKVSTQVHISANGVWGATQPSRYGEGFANVQSYEGIGYHACTKDLLHGFIDSGVEIIVYRYGQKGASRFSKRPARSRNPGTLADSIEEHAENQRRGSSPR